MSRLRLLLLGPAQFVREGEPIELGAAKAIGLLAYLAVTGKAQSRDHLADLLWPHSLPEAARKNLRNTLWTIRKSLGEEALSQVEGDRLALSDGVWVDVRAFEQGVAANSAATKPSLDELKGAVGMYRAPVLDGLNMSEAPEFEIWLVAERERFGQLYLRGLEGLIRVFQTEGRWPEVIVSAQQALVHDNLQEPMYQVLMEANARLGDRSEALRQYERLRNILARELGVEPLGETEALREAILGGEVHSRERARPSGPSRPRPRSNGDGPTRTLFVGRQAECATLDEELDLARGGQARAVLISGELGIGKSRLWEEWSSAQPPSLSILETRCLGTTQSLPFAPLISLFGRKTCSERLFKKSSPLSPIWLAELARLLPEIRGHRPEVPRPADLPPEEERRRLFEALTQTFRALGDRPLVLFIDDLHWADHATLDWLMFLVDRMRDDPMLLVCAYRPDEAPAQLVSMVVGWSRDRLVRRLPLDRLSLHESAELIRAAGGDVARAEQLHRQSAGNPYFTIELSRAGSEATPPSLAEMVRARLARLPQAAQQVLQAAAVLEAGFDFPTLRRTSGRGEEETLDAIDALLDASVVAEQDGGFEFVHPLVAGVVLGDLSIARRSFLHRRAAETLEANYAGRLEMIAGSLARHYTQAGRPARAAQYAEMAAGRALALNAPAEAAAFYRQAIWLEPTPSRRMGLGRALYWLGDLEQARATLGQALAEFEAAGDQSGMAQAGLAMAESYLPSGQGDRVIEWAERVLPSLDPRHDPEAFARACYLLGAGGLQAGGSLTEAEAHLVKAAELAAEKDLPEMSARSQFELGNLLAQRGDLGKALAAFGKTIAFAQAAGARFLEILGHNNLAYHAHLSGDLARARDHIDQGLELAEAHSLSMPRQYLYSTQGEITLAEGRLEQAEDWLRRGLAEAERHGNQLMAANIRANLGLAARARGDLDGALVSLEGAHRGLATISAPYLETQVHLWLAELYLERGERAAAGEALAWAEGLLADSEREGLRAWSDRVKAALGG